MDHFLVDYENIGEAGLKGVEDLGPDTSTIIFYSEHADKISFDMHQILCRCRSKLEFRKAQTGKKNALDFQLSTYLGYLVASHPGDRFFIISKDNGYHVVMDFWNNSNIQQIDYIGRAYEKPARQVQAAASEAQPEQRSGEMPHGRQQEQPRQESPRQEQPRQPQQPQKQEAPRQEVPRQETTKQESPKQETSKPETPEQEAQKQQPQKQDMPKQEPQKQQQSKQETSGQGKRRGGSHKESSVDEFRPSEELMNQLSQLIESREERENIGRFIVRYKTKQGVNNAIVKLYGTEKAGELYRKIKPLLKDKKGK